MAVGLAIGFALLGTALLPFAFDQEPSSGYLRGVAIFGLADMLWTAFTLLLFERGDDVS